MTLRRLLRGEDGVSLLVSLIVLALMMTIGGTVIAFTTANERDSARSRTRVQTHSNAEGGVAAGLSRIYDAVSNPTVKNPFNPTLLPSTKSAAMAEPGQPVQYTNGYAYYWGTIDPLTGEWTITSEAHQKNPTPGGADVVRTVKAKLRVQSVSSTDAGTTAWNWIYAKHTGSTCDMTIQNPGNVNTNVYVEGNLCVENTAVLMGDPNAQHPWNPSQPDGRTIVVKGDLTLRNPQNQVGTSATRVSMYLGRGCTYRNNPYHNPCLGDPDNVFARNPIITGSSNAPPITWPTASWQNAYLNASPGPYYPCAQVAGTPPVFDNDQGPIATASASHMNGSAGTIILTPAYAYTCRTAAGELSWTPGSGWNPGTLTIRGTIFIDGDAQILNNTIVDYNGQAVVYVYGNLLMRSATVCAEFAASGLGGPNPSCDNTAWNPNQNFLLFVVSATAIVGDDDVTVKSTKFQGGLWATNDINIETTSQIGGPALGDYLFIGQTAGTAFPPINIVPTGSPGTPSVITTASPPKIYG